MGTRTPQGGTWCVERWEGLADLSCAFSIPYVRAVCAGCLLGIIRRVEFLMYANAQERFFEVLNARKGIRGFERNLN